MYTGNTRQGEGGGSGFVNVLGAGALSAITGGEESQTPRETEKGAGRAQSSRLRSARHQGAAPSRHPAQLRGAPGEKAKRETKLLSTWLTQSTRRQ